MYPHEISYGTHKNVSRSMILLIDVALVGFHVFCCFFRCVETSKTSLLITNSSDNRKIGFLPGGQSLVKHLRIEWLKDKRAEQQPL